MTNFCRIIIHFIIEYYIIIIIYYLIIYYNYILYNFHSIEDIYILFDKSKYNSEFIQYIEIKNGVNIILR